MSGRVIRDVVPYTVHLSQNRLADRSRLDVIIPEHLPSELETPTSESTEADTHCWFSGI